MHRLGERASCQRWQETECAHVLVRYYGDVICVPVLVQGKGVPLQRQHQVLPKFRQTRFTLQAYNGKPSN